MLRSISIKAPALGLVFLSLAMCACALRAQNAPLYNAEPPSTLLRPGTTKVTLKVTSLQPAQCRYSVGQPLSYANMKPFTIGQGKTAHQTTITGLNSNPSRVNNVYIRCSTQPDFLLQLQYRALPRPKPRFPRTGNLWGSSEFKPKGMAYCARIDLWLGADFTSAQIADLRFLNPNILILASINTIEHHNLPDEYYIKDVNGNRIEVWPGSYLLNLTKPFVADYQARYAYQTVLDSGLMVDGIFFDNVMTTQSWLKTDVYGNPISFDANEDGIADDAAWLDSAWCDGVFREIETFRKYMPNAFVSGHVSGASRLNIAQLFNGDSIGFLSAQVKDERKPFIAAWDAYHNFCRVALKPGISMIESTPPCQIAYGYGYDPLNNIPASTLDFARTYYPSIRFGLALTLMNDGYFAHEYGDILHGQDWWYDELDFDLGFPSAAAKRITVQGDPANPNLLTNGTFEQPLDGTWDLWANAGEGYEAIAERDTSTKKQGTASARITVTEIGKGDSWQISFAQSQRSITGGQSYDLSFWAKADTGGRGVTLSAAKDGPDWRGYGLWEEVSLTTTWKQYTVNFEAKETATDAMIRFLVGNQIGKIWLDDVQLIRHPLDVYRRDFTNGAVLVNGTSERVTVPLGKAFYHLKGDEAPSHQYILDDAGAHFSATGSWESATIESGEWKASGPYYHDWGEGCRRLWGQSGYATWDLDLREDDTYTIQAWWPAGPDSPNRSSQVIFEVMEGDSVISTIILNQRTGGDEWHTIATLPLYVSSAPRVRIRNGAGSGSIIADALHILSSKRLHDGKALSSVTLEPFDGIILRKTNPN